MKRLMMTSLAMVLSFGLLASAEAGNRAGGNRNGGNFRVQIGGGNGGKFIGGGNHNFNRVVSNHQNFKGQSFHHNGNFNGNFKTIDPHIGQNFGHNKFFKNVFIAKPHFQAHQVKVHDYHLKFGRKFDYGYCYVGHTHNHWVSTVWSQECGCWTYYDPCSAAWYYWCQPDGCFYPITYCPHGTYAF